MTFELSSGMGLGVAVLVVAGSIGVMSAGRAEAQPAPSPTTAHREGRISLMRVINGTPAVDARFADSSLWGTEIGRDGPCTLYRRVPTVGLSAGTITITGTSRAITLDPARVEQGIMYRPVGPLPDPAFGEGASITVTTNGAPDLPAFTASVTAPQALAGYTAPKALSRTGYTATWTAGSAPEIMIIVGALDLRAKAGVVAACRVQDAGTFTVPASTFALIPTSLDQAIVMVARFAETVQLVGDTRVMIQVGSGVGSGPFVLAPRPGETSPRRFLSLAAGLGGVSRNGDVPPSRGLGWRLQFGQRLAHGLHLVEEVNSISAAHLSPYATDTSEAHDSFGVGVRWTRRLREKVLVVPDRVLLLHRRRLDVRRDHDLRRPRRRQVAAERPGVVELAVRHVPVRANDLHPVEQHRLTDTEMTLAALGGHVHEERELETREQSTRGRRSRAGRT